MNSLAAMILAFSVLGQVSVDAELASIDIEKHEMLKAYFRHEAEKYELTLRSDKNQKLALEKPVMTYTGLDFKESAGTTEPISGEVYIWTNRGRAILAGGIGAFPHQTGRNIFHEFHALTDSPPAPFQIGKTTVWNWAPPGVQAKPIPGASPPVPMTTRRRTDVQRLLQMKELAADFHAITKFTNSTDENRLKLSSTPLFRLDTEALEKSDSSILDGAIFVFTGVLGTDPELLLLIECLKTDDGLQWTYVPVQFTILETRLFYKGEQVWTVPDLNTSGIIGGNFFTKFAEMQVTLEEIRSRLAENNEDAEADEPL